MVAELQQIVQLVARLWRLRVRSDWAALRRVTCPSVSEYLLFERLEGMMQRCTVHTERNAYLCSVAIR